MEPGYPSPRRTLAEGKDGSGKDTSRDWNRSDVTTIAQKGSQHNKGPCGNSYLRPGGARRWLSFTRPQKPQLIRSDYWRDGSTPFSRIENPAHRSASREAAPRRPRSGWGVTPARALPRTAGGSGTSARPSRRRVAGAGGRERRVPARVGRSPTGRGTRGDGRRGRRGPPR